jgi:DNA-binding NarL/FixJ family response regulator
VKSCLICDDHAMMREALAGAIAYGWPQAQITLAGDFAAARTAALALAADGRPDLILCDLVMPGAAPLEGVQNLRRAAPSTPILVITGNEEDNMLLDLFDAGIAGFASKASDGAIIEAAVRLVLAGGRYLPPHLLDLVARRSGAVAPAPVGARLTERQAEILRLMASGLSNKEIARQLDLSPATVKTHAAAAFAALGAANRTEAVVRARQTGLI